MRLSVAVLAFVLGAQSLVAAAPDPTEAARAALRERAAKWCSLRRESFEQCRTCGGSGRVYYRVGARGVQQMGCYDCSAKGWRFVEEKARNAWLGYRTPAGRAKASAEYSAWVASVRTDPKVAAVTSCKILGATAMEGTRHAVVRFAVEGPVAHEEREIRWVRIAPATGKAVDWYLWTDGADTRWGSEAAVPLAAGDVARLGEALGGAGVAGKVTGAEREGRTLVVRVAEKAASESALAAALERDLLPVTRGSLAAHADATAIRVAFQAPYRDRFGIVALGFFRSYTISRADFERAVWVNLPTHAERAKLFHEEPRGELPEGTVLWLK